ncbi:hypothetical protein FWH30_01995 [Microgenomates group bacterium]|nr:hypothetical protein [Microgenomates group bacterium]
MPRLAHYYLFLHRLVLAIFGYFFIFLFITNIDPAAIANFIFPDSYLPLALLILGANFFFFSFLWQSKFHGLASAFWLQTYLFLILQKVALTPWLLFLLALPWVGIMIFRYNTSIFANPK